MKQGDHPMKFTYDTKPDERECVAYIDDEGDLVIKEKEEGKCVLMFSESGFNLRESTHRFYPGDSITITFE
jgi:hypothetical protein